MASDKNPDINAWAYAGLGFEFAVAVALFAGLGYGLDRWLGTLPWLTLVGMSLGFVAGLTKLLQAGRRMGRKGGAK